MVLRLHELFGTQIESQLFHRIMATFQSIMHDKSVEHFRGYRDEDFEAMYVLDRACFSPVYQFSRQAMRRFATGRRARVVLYDGADGDLAGFCIVHIEPAREGRVGYVVTLDVAETQRRRGLARRMLVHCEDMAREEGCGSMLLHVAIGNEEAIRFYESNGWVRRHTVEAFYGSGLDAFVYRKSLA